MFEDHCTRSKAIQRTLCVIYEPSTPTPAAMLQLVEQIAQLEAGSPTIARPSSAT